MATSDPGPLPRPPDGTGSPPRHRRPKGAARASRCPTVTSARPADDLHTSFAHGRSGSRTAKTATDDGRKRSQRDRDYKDGYQWSSAGKEALKARGQPEITINKIADKVELMCGLERKSRTDPKAFARNPVDEDKADAATQALRYISDDNNFLLFARTFMKA